MVFRPVDKTFIGKRSVLEGAIGYFEIGIFGEMKADSESRADVSNICGRRQKELNSARTGDTWGLSDIGVGGNDLSRSNDFWVYNAYISARFEVPIDALSLFASVC